MAWLKRLNKEHKTFLANNETGDGTLILEEPLVFDAATSGATSVWHVKADGGKDTLYEGETFHVRVTFDDKYPFEAPAVIFEGDVPVHEHVYGNGHICMSSLYDEWSPSLTAYSICLSLQSMLNSATAKKTPPDNSRYCASAPADPRKTRWVFHDDGC